MKVTGKLVLRKAVNNKEHKMRALRTFTEFVEHASSKFKLSMADAEVKILDVLNEKRVSTRAVVAYINWTYYDPMSKAEIAVAMNTSVSTVDNLLRRLKKVWPEVFCSALNQELNLVG